MEMIFSLYYSFKQFTIGIKYTYINPFTSAKGDNIETPLQWNNKSHYSKKKKIQTHFVRGFLDQKLNVN